MSHRSAHWLQTAKSNLDILLINTPIALLLFADSLKEAMIVALLVVAAWPIIIAINSIVFH